MYHESVYVVSFHAFTKSNEFCSKTKHKLYLKILYIKNIKMNTLKLAFLQIILVIILYYYLQKLGTMLTKSQWLRGF